MSKPISDDEKMLVPGYVLGDLTAEEIEQLEQLVADNPDLLKEIHALQASFALLPQGLPVVEPPPALREAIVSAPELQQLLQPRRSTRRLLKVLAGLLTLATVSLILDNFRLRQQLQVAQNDQIDRVASILQQPNSRLISLNGKASEASGTLLFTPGRWQEVIISLGNLPPVPPEQIYRMWLSLENGEVLYCGEFNTNSEGSVFVRFTPPETPPKGVKATGLFVTIDAREAPLTPSGERIMEGTI
ncbi:anti-sigma factor [Leptothoe sp. PORK10 BA2]|uniref:anti-sigma factor n=1 Tax=Leptothoe sp. PORK10 BA2 TaxID=3110254 RepID=UPI002B20AAFA|nr:anti-sigma factor [Leptothoe sp. PORK10 BA2]MEA5467089.1 anti-sigma factor [Leptothoe sp. PORK10 BA2]